MLSRYRLWGLAVSQALRANSDVALPLRRVSCLDPQVHLGSEGSGGRDCTVSCSPRCGSSCPREQGWQRRGSAVTRQAGPQQGGGLAARPDLPAAPQSTEREATVPHTSHHQLSTRPLALQVPVLYFSHQVPRRAEEEAQPGLYLAALHRRTRVAFRTHARTLQSPPVSHGWGSVATGTPQLAV